MQAVTQRLTYGIFCDIIVSSTTASALSSCQLLVHAASSMLAPDLFIHYYFSTRSQQHGQEMDVATFLLIKVAQKLCSISHHSLIETTYDDLNSGFSLSDMMNKVKTAFV